MQKNTKITRWIAISASLFIVMLILWNTYQFFQKFKIEERSKMEILGKAYERFGQADLDDDVELERFIQVSNKTIPMIITDENDQINLWSNLSVDNNTQYHRLSRSNKNKLDKALDFMKSQNNPIVINYQLEDFKVQQLIYYSDSSLLNKLKYYPLTLIIILLLFMSVIYLFFKSSKVAEQNKLWTGMAKETAHQIGTPLSSLLGWIEILKMENIDENIVPEIEKDVYRLNEIADRFSKIGSKPVLEKLDLIKETQNAFKYLKNRSSKQIEFSFESEYDSSKVKLNSQLYSWVIENLVKNAIDSMQGVGKINIRIIEKTKYIQVLISDTGKGIHKSLHKEIFTPGYTTKKRGWGLGLSLSKRIVEEYHNGRIYVKKSEIDKGTTFCISLQKL